MKKTLSLIALAAVFTSSAIVRADEAPISVESFQLGQEAQPEEAIIDENGNEQIELTVDQVAEDMQAEADAAAGEGLGEETSDYRIKDYTPAAGSGKIIIRVYKSDNTKVKPEYIEVVKQNSADANDITPIKVFDGGSSRALTSTGAKSSMTPTGTFGIDTMKTMHYSSKYNNAPMPHSMFFNGGIAVHGTVPSNYKNLGHKASHGCVRLHQTNSKLLFEYIKKNGAKNTIIQVLNQ